MPTASDEDRAHAIGLWGSICMGGPVQHLKTRGWTIVGNYEWQKPTPDHKPTDDEYFAIEFLADEWDWGGLRNQL